MYMVHEFKHAYKELILHVYRKHELKVFMKNHDEL